MPLNESKKVAAIIADAGGRVVGRTRLQKIVYLLTVTGFEDEFSFSYKHYGPYSEDLAMAARVGKFFGDLNETEQAAAWGGSYSIYTATSPHGVTVDEPRRQFTKAAADADAIELELAATAVLLSGEGYDDPWVETARRKPEKTGSERIENAKGLLRALARIQTPRPLPGNVYEDL